MFQCWILVLHNTWFVFHLQNWHAWCLVTCLLPLFMWWIKSFVPARSFSSLRFNTMSQCTKLCSGASYMFIESVLFREYIGCQHQLVALVQWSFVVLVQSRTAIQLALAIQTRVPDHLRYHFGFLLECRWVSHVISIWWGQGCLPVLWCTSKTDYLKSGRHLKQMLGEMPSSNKFASMQQQKGKRYFCLFIQFTCFV
jgi:hypothetical protein